MPSFWQQIDLKKTQSIANEPAESSSTNIKSMNYLANELGETKLKFDDLFSVTLFMDTLDDGK